MYNPVYVIGMLWLRGIPCSPAPHNRCGAGGTGRCDKRRSSVQDLRKGLSAEIRRARVSVCRTSGRRRGDGLRRRQGHGENPNATLSRRACPSAGRVGAARPGAQHKTILGRAAEKVGTAPAKFKLNKRPTLTPPPGVQIDSYESAYIINTLHSPPSHLCCISTTRARKSCRSNKGTMRNPLSDPFQHQTHKDRLSSYRLTSISQKRSSSSSTLSLLLLSNPARTDHDPH